MKKRILIPRTPLQRIMTLAALLLVCVPGYVRSQHLIHGTINGYNQRTIVLSAIRGDQQLPVDSVKTNREGYFRLETKNWYQPGMYFLQTDEDQHIKIIYNNTDIQLVSDNTTEDVQVEFVGSDENKLWYEYSVLKAETKAKKDLINPILQQYPQDETFYQQAVEAYNQLQQQLISKADYIYLKHSETLAARFIRADVPPMINLQLPYDEQLRQLKNHFFDKTDFADTLLLNSDVLTTKMIDFLALHQQPQMDMSALQYVFIEALDVIMKNAAVEKKTYLFALEYFIEGFARMGFTGITDYLSNLPHLNNECMDMQTLMDVERIAGAHRRVITGSAAPEIVSNDIHGHPFSLEQTKEKVKLLVFWSVNCPHCLLAIPEIKKLAEKWPQIQIISFVLSTDRNKLDEIIAREQLSWIHLSDGLGWNSTVAQEYMVYGTPTLFLIDEQNNILSKPASVAEAEAVIQLHFNKPE